MAEVVCAEAEVAFGDCDPGGIAWHGNYWRWFEAGRTALMRKIGLDVPDMVGLGIAVVVTDARCRYHRPLRYGDRIVIETWLEQLGPGVVVRYRLTCGGKKTAEARTTLVVVDPRTGALMRPPAEVMARLQAFA
jgi:acyl-CoA thioester hydrolase